MSDFALAGWLARRRIHYAWVMAAVTFLTMLMTAAALGLPGALLPALGKEFGWDVAQVSSPLALRFVLYGLLGPFSAILIERIGLRRVIVLALTLVGGSMLLATRVTTLGGLFLVWGLMLGGGSGLTALVLGAVVANRWFTAHRGLVIGMLTASSATGQLVFLPIAAWLIEHHGWRMAVLPVAIGCAAVGALALLLVRDRPADVGLLPFGESGAPAALVRAAPPPFTAPLTALRDAAATRTFWLLAGSFFICGLSTNGLVQTHFISLCGDYGLGPVPAASVLALMGAFDFVGTIASGWLSDRWDSRKLLCWYYALRGLSLFWLPHSGFGFEGLWLFAMFYGLDWIATVPPTVKLAANAFGRDKVGLVFGWIFAAHQLGAAVAAYGAGFVRSVVFSYTPALYVAGAACLIAAVGVLAIRQGLAARFRPLAATAP